MNQPRTAPAAPTLLTLACPAFRLAHLTRACHPRRLAVRKNTADPGVHTVLTDDLDELQAALGPVTLPPRPAPHGQPGARP